MVNEPSREIPKTPVVPAQTVAVPRRRYPMSLLLLLPLVAIAAAYILFRSNQPDVSIDTPRPTQTQVPPSTQKAGRLLSHVATESAYLELEQRVVDLSSQISQTATLDVRTAPPSLILPLGFK